jgi:hypothetical protein
MVRPLFRSAVWRSHKVYKYFSVRVCHAMWNSPLARVMQLHAVRWRSAFFHDVSNVFLIGWVGSAITSVSWYGRAVAAARRLTLCPALWLCDWATGSFFRSLMQERRIDLPTGWLIGWLDAGMTHWPSWVAVLSEWLIHYRNCLTGWLKPIGWVTCWSCSWLIDSLIGWINALQVLLP